MRFTIEQRFDAGPDEVARVFTEPRLYEAFQDLPKLSRPDVLAHEVEGDVVRLQIRYRFSGELSAAARAVLDPARLTWVEHSTHDLTDRSTTFTMVPDHYADRFRCSGRYQFEPLGEGTIRRGEGEVKVKALLVAGAVESAIVSGLREHLADEVGVVNDLLGG